MSRFLIGVVLGLFFSFSLYALQYATREIFRVFSLSDEGDLWILSDAEVNFYNLTCAFIAVIFGQSICFGYWFDRPFMGLRANSTRIKDIINDQRFLNWYFMAWFSKVAVVYAAIFGFAGSGWFYLNSFYPDYNYLFILMIVVLFLQSWHSILRTFRRKAQKWMLLSAIIVSLVSYGMSKINIIDYQNLNRILIGNRVDVKYKLEIPTAGVSDTLIRRFRELPTISLVLSKNKDTINTEPILLVGNTEFSFNELLDTIQTEMDRLHKHEKDRNYWYLAIDKEVTMRHVHRLLESMAAADIKNLRYQIIPRNSKYDNRYNLFYEKTSLSFFNPSHFGNPYEIRVQKVKDYSNLIEIKTMEDGYTINDQKYIQSNLKEEIMKLVKSNSDYVITYSCPEGLSFDRYFGAYSAIREAIREFRDMESLRLYKKDFNELRSSFNARDEQMEIMEHYPLRILDISPNLKHMPSSAPYLPD